MLCPLLEPAIFDYKSDTIPKQSFITDIQI